MDDKLSNAINLIEMGDKKAAEKILREVINEDLNNEKAWLRLASISKKFTEQCRCLERVLEINPGNEIALRRLEELDEIKAEGAKSRQPSEETFLTTGQENNEKNGNRNKLELNKPLKILVGLATAWIIFYPLLFIVVWFSMMTGFIFPSSMEPPTFIFSLFPVIFPIHCLTFIIQFALMGFYLFHIIKNTIASDVLRIILGVGTFFMPYIAMPVYYYFFIWREEPPEWTISKEVKPNLKTGESTSQDIASTVPRHSGVSRKTLVIGGGIVGVGVLIFCVLIVMFTRFMANFNQTVRDNLLAIPTPIAYDSLPDYDETEKPFYRPAETTALFTPIKTFKGISIWNYYNQNSILVIDDTIIIAGHIQEPDNSWMSGMNVDLVSANINTGEVNWQGQAGSAFLLKDARYIYAESLNDFGSYGAGVVAYDMKTGEPVWETRFDYNYANGIDRMSLIDNGLVVETYYNHGQDAWYILDTGTGKIKEEHKNTTRQAADEELVYNNVVLKKQGYGIPDSITAHKRNDGSLVWQFDDMVVSNIAIGGEITYFLTKDAKLTALNTETGEILGTLSFAPRILPDSVNTSFIVAADKNVVAVYFEDSKQLSVFHFNQSIQ